AERRMYAAGVGMLTIAHRLNAEAVQPPRGRGWAPSGIREMLHRSLYRGEIVWNRSQKVIKAGTKKKRRRPASEWMTMAAPDLRIVSEDLWQRVKARLEQRAASFPRSPSSASQTTWFGTASADSQQVAYFGHFE